MGGEDPFRWAIGLWLLTTLAFGPYFRIRAHRAGGPVSRRGEGPGILYGLRLAGLAWMASIVAFLVDPATTAWARLPLPEAARWAGLVPAAAAFALLVWMFRTLGRNLTDTVAVRPEATLVTSGPYRWVRHPMYAGLILMGVGMALLTARGTVALGGLATLAFLAARTPIEEANLAARFGEAYRTYRARTGAVVPRLGRHGASA